MINKNNNIKQQEYLKEMLKNNLLAVIYPKDRSKEAAEKLAGMISSAVGIAEFNKNEEGDSMWGVLIDKVKEAKKYTALDSFENKILNESGDN